MGARVTRGRPSGQSSVLAVVPAYGRSDLTWSVVESLSREGEVTTIIVDNLGDYLPQFGEHVLRPGRNLGWAGGTNLGLKEGLSQHYDFFLCLNNDVRLSRSFVAGLLRCVADTGAALAGPFYDCHWFHQRLQASPLADHYRPRRAHYSAPFVDGTAMFVPRSTLSEVGLLDDRRYTPWGHGADIDFATRVRNTGGSVVITRLAYLQHQRAATARQVMGDNYETEAYARMVSGLESRWGTDWQATCGIAYGPTAMRNWRHRVGSPAWSAAQRSARMMRPLKRAATRALRGVKEGPLPVERPSLHGTGYDTSFVREPTEPDAAPSWRPQQGHPAREEPSKP